MKNTKLPELLSPAGSPEAFEAAIDGGADAIYLGGASFNARINAKNFSPEDMQAAVRLAHSYGVKVYQTVNIMVHDRELADFLYAAEQSAMMGVDGFIVSDLGAASLLHRALPDMPLHGSTQMSVHNAAGAALLAEYGFTRVVPARELSRENIDALVKKNPLEVEIFVHGALCVSHSGQCLFSSLVGGRSGNRGLCAQPCRLPYCSGESRCGDKYPLSLKDLSLAGHVKEIIESGVASLKIEGRMKSAEYVRGVTKIWRRLLDEGRDATPSEMRELSELFSRGGFTDGYYTGAIGHKMLGVRSDADKQLSREGEKFHKIQRKLPIDMKVTLEIDKPALLSVTYGKKQIFAEGTCPEAAINAPIDEETVKKCMAKLGESPFVLQNIEISLVGRLMMPISRLNALRRDAVEKLIQEISRQPAYAVNETGRKHSHKSSLRRNVGRFSKASQVTSAAKDFFDVILLPLAEFVSSDFHADGFFMPVVTFDSEMEDLKQLLYKAAEKKPLFALLSNLGQVALVKEMVPDVNLIADFRFNTANDEGVVFLENMGFESIVLSPELTLPQIRDIHGSKAVLVYGHLPLMTIEKCVIKELYGKEACQVCSKGEALMKDRKGVFFPIMREADHRNLVLNSFPTYMGDRVQALEGAGITDRHFFFTVESPEETDQVIEDHLYGRTASKNVRRI